MHNGQIWYAGVWIYSKNGRYRATLDASNGALVVRDTSTNRLRWSNNGKSKRPRIGSESPSAPRTH